MKYNARNKAYKMLKEEDLPISGFIKIMKENPLFNDYIVLDNKTLQEDFRKITIDLLRLMEKQEKCDKLYSKKFEEKYKNNNVSNEDITELIQSLLISIIK